MSGEQMDALLTCFFVGVFGAMLTVIALDGQINKKWKFIIAGWLLFWCSPGLIHVYITAVMG